MHTHDCYSTRLTGCCFKLNNVSVECLVDISNVNVECLVDISIIRYYTTESSSRWCNSFIDTIQIDSSIITSVLIKRPWCITFYWDCHSVRKIPLSRSVWCLIGDTLETFVHTQLCISLPNLRDGNKTIVRVDLTFQQEVDPYDYTIKIRLWVPISLTSQPLEQYYPSASVSVMICIVTHLCRRRSYSHIVPFS